MNQRSRALVLLGAEALVMAFLIVALAMQGYRAWGVNGAVLMPLGCIAVGAGYLVYGMRRSRQRRELGAENRRTRSRVNPWLLGGWPSSSDLRPTSPRSIRVTNPTPA
jgi:hypothetical protein